MGCSLLTRGLLLIPFENKLMLSSLAVTFVNLGIGAVSRIPKEGIPSSINPYLDNIMFKALVFGANSLVIGLLARKYKTRMCWDKANGQCSDDDYSIQRVNVHAIEGDMK